MYIRSKGLTNAISRNCDYVYLAGRTDTQYDRLLALSCRPSVRPSFCLSIVALRVGVQDKKLDQCAPI